MSWIQTYTGQRFWPLDPRPEQVEIRDIAHALSLACRFNGHCLAFYSVAEHSVRVSRVVTERHPADDRLALWGLLHDAAEAYVGDLPRPVKAEAPWFRETEDRILRVIMESFSLPWPMPAPVREADDILLATEARDLMAPPPADWGLGVQPLAEPIIPLPPTEAEALFLDRFQELRPCGGQ